MLPNMHTKGKGLRGHSVSEESTWKSSLLCQGWEVDTLSHVRDFICGDCRGGGTEDVVVQPP